MEGIMSAMTTNNIHHFHCFNLKSWIANENRKEGRGKVIGLEHICNTNILGRDINAIARASLQFNSSTVTPNGNWHDAGFGNMLIRYYCKHRLGSIWMKWMSVTDIKQTTENRLTIMTEAMYSMVLLFSK